MEMTEQCLDAAPVTMEGKCCLENAMISNSGKTNKSHVTAEKKAKGGKLALPVCVILWQRNENVHWWLSWIFSYIHLMENYQYRLLLEYFNS